MVCSKQPSDRLDGMVGALGPEPAVERLPLVSRHLRRLIAWAPRSFSDAEGEGWPIVQKEPVEMVILNENEEVRICLVQVRFDRCDVAAVKDATPFFFATSAIKLGVWGTAYAATISAI